MAWNAPANSGEGFTPPPEGFHAARCVRIVDLGTTFNEMYNKNRHQIMIEWELPDFKVEFERDGQKISRPGTIAAFYTLSMGEKANLRKVIESWFNKSFPNDAAAEAFDLEKLLNYTAMITVAHKEKGNGDKKAIINNIGPLPAFDPSTGHPMGIPEASCEVYAFKLHEYSDEIFAKLSEGLQNLVKKSDEYKARMGVSEEPPHVQDHHDGFDPNDDIPF
jgi:hypothetical protein